jgi:hypothetical protein
LRQRTTFRQTTFHQQQIQTDFSHMHILIEILVSSTQILVSKIDDSQVN